MIITQLELPAGYYLHPSLHFNPHNYHPLHPNLLKPSKQYMWPTRSILGSCSASWAVMFTPCTLTGLMTKFPRGLCRVTPSSHSKTVDVHVRVWEPPSTLSPLSLCKIFWEFQRYASTPSRASRGAFSSKALVDLIPTVTKIRIFRNFTKFTSRNQFTLIIFTHTQRPGARTWIFVPKNSVLSLEIAVWDLKNVFRASHLGK